MEIKKKMSPKILMENDFNMTPRTYVWFEGNRTGLMQNQTIGDELM